VRRQRRGVQLLCLIFAFVLLAAGCGKSGTSKGSGSGGSSAAASTGKKGGTLILGAEQWPDCLNPITQCANSSWMHWAVDEHVLPRLMDFDKDGNFVPSPVLKGAPVVDGKGTGKNESSPFSVTFDIDPNAVWDDGSPITADDIEFTWHAYLDTVGTISTVGYDKIDHIEKSNNNKTAKVVFKDTFADAFDLFGGNSAYLLKKAAFASTDTSKDMVDSIPFSGKGLKLESFTKDQAVMVPNTKYWNQAQMPLVDKVIAKPFTDTDTELNALKAGEVMAGFPQPSPGIKDKLSDPNIKLQFGASVSFEGLWFNQDSLKNPNSVLKDKVVRQALLFAFDRQAILDNVYKNISPDVTTLNCAFWVPTVAGGKYCDENEFKDLTTSNPDKVKSLLEGDGWAKGADGIYAKNGTRLSITWQTVAGNKRREAIQDLEIPKLKDLGIELIKDNSDADTLFQQRLPHRDTELMLFINSASPDPSVQSSLACDAIPTPENNFAGQNDYSWCNQSASADMKSLDQVVDENARAALVKKIGQAFRDDAVGLPLTQFPTLTVIRTDKIEGPVGDFTNSPGGGFENIYAWSVK
jgi:peptide/nickel transport system substrate-binding protein